MLHIRRSFLEGFRRVLETPYGDEEALVRAIRGNPDPVSWQADAGTAWHSALADDQTLTFSSPHTPDDRGRLVHSGFYCFSILDVVDAREYVGPGLTEVPGRMHYHRADGCLEVTGTADHIHGLKIQDHKTKFSPCNAQDYEQSLQWRFYLLIHECSVFQYNLWSLADPKDGYCRLKNVIDFRFFPYAGMEADCRDWVRRFVEWAGDKGLLPYLEKP